MEDTVYKPFKTIEDQVTLLESRGVECGRGTDATLLREGYYSVINGYKDPFLDAGATIAAGDDRYIPGTRFEDILHLFDFDRRLRLATFGALTLAEAALRTTCAYCFSEMHQNEPNAYLNPRNLHQPPKARKDIVGPMIGQMRKIIDNGGKDPEHGGKVYLHHCLADHGGEVPLWVLTNDMTIGQVTNFYRVMGSEARGAVARQFESLYASSHRKKRRITSGKLDSVYSRVKNFRNICAHDERLYCARPFGDNNSFAQLATDLELLLTKQRHREFLQRVESLMLGLERDLPGHAGQIFSAMGVVSIDRHQKYMDSIRDN